MVTQRTESSLRRGCGDAWRDYGGAGFQWSAVIASALVGVTTAFLMPDAASARAQTVYGITAALASYLFTGLLFLLWNMFRAPYRQRNELAVSLATIVARPTVTVELVDCQWGQEEDGMRIARICRIAFRLFPSQRAQIARVQLCIRESGIDAGGEEGFTQTAVDALGFSTRILEIPEVVPFVFQVPGKVATGRHTAYLTVLGGAGTWLSNFFDLDVPTNEASFG